MTTVSTIHAPSPTVTVCLVEDHPLLRELLCELLNNTGYRVLAAVGTVRDAKTAIFEYRPDVVIIDNHLPDGRGVDLIRILALTTPKTALVLHSRTATLGDAREAVQAGASAVILKSARGHSLVEAVRISHRIKGKYDLRACPDAHTTPGPLTDDGRWSPLKETVTRADTIREVV